MLHRCTAGALRASLVAWLLLFVQMLCSVTAGVYNEVLLKDRGRIPTNLQNGYLYFNSVLCNFGVLLAQGKLGEALAMDNLRTICTPTLIMIILVMYVIAAELLSKPFLYISPRLPLQLICCVRLCISLVLFRSSVGLVTGFFLRHLDSVLKAVASALEVVASMFISYAVFGVAFGPQVGSTHDEPHALAAPHHGRSSEPISAFFFSTLFQLSRSRCAPSGSDCRAPRWQCSGLVFTSYSSGQSTRVCAHIADRIQ